MLTVALIGPDGAGKTTVCRALEARLAVPSKYVYMGVGCDSANVTLPTTWIASKLAGLRGAKVTYGGRSMENRYKRPAKGLIRRPLSEIKSVLSLLNQLAEEWFRQCVVWFHRLRGSIVLLDRHFVADYALDILNPGSDAPWRRRVHAFVLNRFYPKPDLLVYLDAPPDVLLARKKEGSLESLERMRQEYMDVRKIVKNFVVVDASQSLAIVTDEVEQLVLEYCESKADSQTKVRYAR